MKRVLIITYYWPPTGGSGVQRWEKFAKYLPDEGWQPVIYTPSNPEMLAVDECLLSEIPECAEVIKSRIVEPYSIYNFFSRKKEINPINSQKKNWKQKLALYIRSNYFVPDPRVTWVNKSVTLLERYLKSNPVDVIISTGPPHSMHLIAQKVSAKLRIPWIADFRDPWTKMFYFNELKLRRRALRKHLKLEQSVLDDANTVIAVSPLVRDDFQSRTNTPVALITNGYDEEDFSIEVKPNGYFNIVHTGLFASDGIPTTLWKVLSDLMKEDPELRNQLCIRLVGKTDVEVLDSLKEYGMSDNVLDLKYKSHIETIFEQKAASLLILPLRKAAEYRKTLPGKIFEYLAARRPVLGIGQPDGAASKLLRDCNAGRMFDWDDYAGTASYVRKAWESHKRGEWNQIPGDISRFTRRALTSDLARLMDSLILKYKKI